MLRYCTSDLKEYHLDTVYELFSNFISLSLDASPWLCLGLIIAGLMKSGKKRKLA